MSPAAASRNRNLWGRIVASLPLNVKSPRLYSLSHCPRVPSGPNQSPAATQTCSAVPPPACSRDPAIVAFRACTGAFGFGGLVWRGRVTVRCRDWRDVENPTIPRG
jgi:hypothetical protein